MAADGTEKETDTLPPADTISIGRALEGLVVGAENLGLAPREFEEGEVLLFEGQQNECLFILLEGELRLFKTGAQGKKNEVDRLGPGSLVGILSFWSAQPAFSGCEATTAGRLLRMDRSTFERGVADDQSFARTVTHLMWANLSDRYRHVVGLNQKIADLSWKLERKHDALARAIADLERTRNEMVHREKLATMGQLLAGIAHEINNPASSLIKSVEYLSAELPAVFDASSSRRTLIEQGLRARYLGSAEMRQKLEACEESFPHLGRPLCRRLARLTDEARDQLASLLHSGTPQQIEAELRLFEIGGALRGVEIANERITRLVKSLKSYSRQDDGEAQQSSLHDCLRDTLIVLNHRLKQYDLQLQMGDLPLIYCKPGEINQIFTNLLTNACDASELGGTIEVKAESDDKVLWVEVSDRGHGIPDDLLPHIFEPNVTTKGGGGDYGLGLGLAISRDLAIKHGGSLRAKNRPDGGAVFRLELPRT